MLVSGSSAFSPLRLSTHAWSISVVGGGGGGGLFFFQAEDGIRDLVRSRGLGDVYKRQRLQSVSLVILL